MQNNKKVEYDKAEIYEKEIAPLVHQLVEACNFNRIPLFVSAAVTNKDGKTNYQTETLSAAQFNMSLADDKVADYKRKKRGLESFQVNFTHPGSARDIFNASAPFPAPVRLMTEHRQFLDDYFSGEDFVKQKSLEMLNVMMRQYLYYQDMSRNSKALFDRALDVAFEYKDKSKQAVIVEIRERYEI